MLKPAAARIVIVIILPKTPTGDAGRAQTFLLELPPGPPHLVREKVTELF